MSASTAHYGGGGGGDVPIEPVRQVVGFDVGNTQGAAIHNNMDNADGTSATMNEYRQEGHNYDANQSGTAAATSGAAAAAAAAATATATATTTTTTPAINQTASAENVAEDQLGALQTTAPSAIPRHVARAEFYGVAGSAESSDDLGRPDGSSPPTMIFPHLTQSGSNLSDASMTPPRPVRLEGSTAGGATANSAQEIAGGIATTFQAQVQAQTSTGEVLGIDEVLGGLPLQGGIEVPQPQPQTQTQIPQPGMSAVAAVATEAAELVLPSAVGHIPPMMENRTSLGSVQAPPAPLMTPSAEAANGVAGYAATPVSNQPVGSVPVSVAPSYRTAESVASLSSTPQTQHATSLASSYGLDRGHSTASSTMSTSIKSTTSASNIGTGSIPPHPHSISAASTVPVATVAGGEAGAASNAASTPSVAPEEKPRGPPQDKGTTKPPRPTTKAERRELQERQRAEKAARLAAEGKAPPPSKSGSAPKDDKGDKPSKASRAQGSSNGGGGGGGGSGGGGGGHRGGSHGGSLGGRCWDLFSNLPAWGGHAASDKEAKAQDTALAVSFGMTRRVLAEGGSGASEPLHTSVVELGVKLRDGKLRGSSARCLAMIEALKDIIRDYKPEATAMAGSESPSRSAGAGQGSSEGGVTSSATPEIFQSRDLLHKINVAIEHIVECRPLGIAMGNAIKYLKRLIPMVENELRHPSQSLRWQGSVISLTELENARDEGDEDDDEASECPDPVRQAKKLLLADLDKYAQEKIIGAQQHIVDIASQHIKQGDNILIYEGTSDIITRILVTAKRMKPNAHFSVVVVDSRPYRESTKALRVLLQNGISCTYSPFYAVERVCGSRSVTKAFIGAAGVASNGYVLSRLGTASICMLASSYKVPVVICCESCKFTERVLLDSVTMNELRDPADLLKMGVDGDVVASTPKHAKLRHLLPCYDVTPMKYITMVISEHGAVPPTAVPLFL
ncbi:translation initiation factor eIF-2B subunit delta [Pseudoscourfieldia marina]